MPSAWGADAAGSRLARSATAPRGEGRGRFQGSRKWRERGRHWETARVPKSHRCQSYRLWVPSFNVGQPTTPYPGLACTYVAVCESIYCRGPASRAAWMPAKALKGYRYTSCLPRIAVGTLGGLLSTKSTNLAGLKLAVKALCYARNVRICCVY